MTILIQLTTVGADVGTSFNLYSNLDEVTPLNNSPVSLATLLAGYLCTTVPDGTTLIKVVALDGVCNTVKWITVITTTTTTTSTSSTTTTSTTTVEPEVGEAGSITIETTASKSIDTVSFAGQPCVGAFPITVCGTVTFNSQLTTGTLIVNCTGAASGTLPGITVIDSMSAVQTLEYTGTGAYEFNDVVIDGLTPVSIVLSSGEVCP